MISVRGERARCWRSRKAASRGRIDRGSLKNSGSHRREIHGRQHNNQGISQPRLRNYLVGRRALRAPHVPLLLWLTTSERGNVGLRREAEAHIR